MSTSNYAPPEQNYRGAPWDNADDTLDLRSLFRRIGNGLHQIFGLAMLGLAITSLGYLIYSPYQTISTSTRVVLSFPGFERGQYPDGSKFQPDDLRAPVVIAEALKQRGFNTSPEFQGLIRAALTIQGNIPQNLVRERDRLRASGQTPPPFIPDEYVITLAAPRKFELTVQQRTQLLSEIVSVYSENFRRTYADTPLAFGNAFAILRDADYPDFESVFDREMRAIAGYLEQQSDQAKLYRAPSTNLSFADLFRQTQLLAQIRLNETLGLIRQNGLSKDRRMALVKLNDSLRVFNDDERRASDEESVVRDLLSQAQSRDRNYVLGVKTQAAQPRGEAPILDQGVIDSLLANDSYNFLVRRALDVGVRVKTIQSDKARVVAMIENLKAFEREQAADQSALISQLQRSMAALEKSYDELITNVRKTHADYARQQFGDAIRMSAQISTSGTGIRPLLLPIVVGFLLGFAAGTGLSLMGIYIGRGRKPEEAI